MKKMNIIKFKKFNFLLLSGSNLFNFLSFTISRAKRKTKTLRILKVFRIKLKRKSFDLKNRFTKLLWKINLNLIIFNYLKF